MKHKCQTKHSARSGADNIARYVMNNLPRELLRAADPGGAVYVWVPDTGNGPLRQEIAMLSPAQLADTPRHHAALQDLSPSLGAGVIIDVETAPGRSLTTVTRMQVF